jgi:hypothetical protein
VAIESIIGCGVEAAVRDVEDGVLQPLTERCKLLDPSLEGWGMSRLQNNDLLCF